MRRKRKEGEGNLGEKWDSEILEGLFNLFSYFFWRDTFEVIKCTCLKNVCVRGFYKNKMTVRVA